MARNKSEKPPTERQLMVNYRDALRHLVQVNLDAGAAPDFPAANVIRNTDVQAAWAAYRVAHKKWNGERITNTGCINNWPAILRNVEAYVEEKLRGTQ